MPNDSNEILEIKPSSGGKSSSELLLPGESAVFWLKVVAWVYCIASVYAALWIEKQFGTVPDKFDIGTEANTVAIAISISVGFQGVVTLVFLLVVASIGESLIKIRKHGIRTRRS